MENLRSKGLAGTVATVNLFLEVLILLGHIVFIITWVMEGEEIIREVAGNHSKDEDAIMKIQTFTWVTIAIASICISVKLWTARLLWKATHVETDISKCLNQSRIWAVVTSVFLAFQFISSFLLGFNNTSLITLFLCVKDVAFLYIVKEFIDEMAFCSLVQARPQVPLQSSLSAGTNMPSSLLLPENQHCQNPENPWMQAPNPQPGCYPASAPPPYSALTFNK